MKLAEALMLRTEYQDKLNSLTGRIAANLKVQEGEKPHEDPNALLKEAVQINGELCSLVKKINKRNNEIKLADGQTVSEALAERDMLSKKRQMFSNIVLQAMQKDHRLTHSEIKMCTTVDIAGIQKEIDALSKQFRMIDTQIQERNWSVDLD